MKYAVMNLSKNEHLERPYFRPNSCIGIYINIYQMTGEIFKGDSYNKLWNQTFKHWQQMSASACFKTIVRTRHSTGIKQALGVNRYKGMGTSWRESNQNYVTIRQQSSSRSIQSKLSLKTSVQVKFRSGSRDSQSNQNKNRSDQLFLYKRWILRWRKWSIFDEGQFYY